MQRSGDEVQHDPRKLSEKEEEKSEDDEDAERSGAQQGRAGGLPRGTGRGRGFRSVAWELLTPARACSRGDLTVCLLPSPGPGHRGHPQWKGRTAVKLTVAVCSHGKQRNRRAKAVAGESLALHPAACVLRGLSEEAGPPGG